MIAVDTNVLLRYLLQDDTAQATKAEKLISGRKRVLVTDVVLVEMLWTLRGKRYKLSHEQIAGVVEALFEEPNIRFEDGQAVWMALNDYREANVVQGAAADFPDALIANKAHSVAKAQGAAFSGLYSFDKAAQTLPGVKKP